MLVNEIMLEAKGKVIGFTTSMGSTYKVLDDGRTVRTKKSIGRGQGETYDPHNVLYATPHDKDNIMANLQAGMGDHAVRLGYVKDNMFYTLKNNQVPISNNPVIAIFSRTTNKLIGVYRGYRDPKVGLHPVEKLYFANGKSSTHIGNSIVSLELTP